MSSNKIATWTIATCAVINTIPRINQENWHTNWVYYLNIPLLIIIIYIFRSKRNQKLKYANNFSEVITAISSFINAYDGKKSSLLYNTRTLLQEMSDIFKDIKGVDCNFTMIVLNSNNNEFVTFCRVCNLDRGNREKYREHYGTYEQFLEDNSDLDKIFGSNKNYDQLKDLYYFSNNLIKDEYHHPFLVLKGFKDRFKDTKGWFNQRKMEKQWCLKFKSTIVVPLGLMQKSNHDPKHPIVGTLCIDADKKNVFKKEIDLSIMQSLAETIYLTIKSIEKKKKLKHKTISYYE